MRAAELIFLGFFSASNLVRIFQSDSVLGCLYLLSVITYLLDWLLLRPVRGPIMFTSPLSIINVFICFTLQFNKISDAESPDVVAASSPTKTATSARTDNGATTSFRPIFTVPTDADIGAPILPNILDPDAIDAQSVCPGYSASNVVRTISGLAATLNLAGKPCNIYGTDIDTLNLTVEYQSSDRLSVKISPAILDASNVTQYNLRNDLLIQPTIDVDAGSTSLKTDLSFVWTNDPTFSFSIYRISTGDVLL